MVSFFHSGQRIHLLHVGQVVAEAQDNVVSADAGLGGISRITNRLDEQSLGTMEVQVGINELGNLFNGHVPSPTVEISTLELLFEKRRQCGPLDLPATAIGDTDFLISRQVRQPPIKAGQLLDIFSKVFNVAYGQKHITSLKSGRLSRRVVLHAGDQNTRVTLNEGVAIKILQSL